VDELLDVSQIQLGRLQLKLEEMDLSELARDVVGHMQEEAKRAGSKLVLRAEETATGRWDRTRLQQVVANLIGNAVKYGGGKPVEVWVDADPATAHLSIEDHGPGIAPDDQTKIFELFARTAAAAGVAAGLGLGLFIARQIVEAHGGRILLDSVPGTGSKFTVNLPRAAGEASS
jgi:signal transduction histidine kinase